MTETKISDIIKTSLANIREIVDANTIIGDPITTPGGTVILPVSKVSVGVATGGLDFASKKESLKEPNFGGGGGTGLNVTPIAFLVVNPDGGVELLSVDNPTDQSGDTLTALLTLAKKTPDIIGKVKTMFTKNKDNGDTEEKTAEEVAPAEQE